MNGKQAKELRRWAREIADADPSLVEVPKTKRVRTAANGTKVVTHTLAHQLGSFRNVLKLLKGRGGYELFNPATNNHALPEA